MSIYKSIMSALLLMSMASLVTAAGGVTQSTNGSGPAASSQAIEPPNKESCGVDKNGQHYGKLQNAVKQQFEQARGIGQAMNRTAHRDGYDSFNHEHKRKHKHKHKCKRRHKHGRDCDDNVEAPYYIPVVFHIYGQQFNCDDASLACLTDEKIIDGLKRLNEDFQGLNTLDGPIAPEFQAVRKNLNIEFVLAQADPNGAATNGIVRYNREQAGYGNGSGYNDLIAADAWDNFKYMNVYIMNDLYNNGTRNNSGVAWYPDLAMSEANTARVVYNGWYIGSNTNENFRSVLTHEFGHWLNLPHTFDEYTCSLSNEAFCALTGDRSCDTPQMSMSSDMQDNAVNCLGQKTNTENFMHYSNNYAMFTSDQVDRMIAALHGPSRASIWSYENLIATGLGHLADEDAEHEWDGVSGLGAAPEGEVIATYSDLSSPLDGVQTFTVNAPENSQTLAFYLDGFTEDPDLYASFGRAPSVDGYGNWTADYVSYKSSGTPEFIGILAPKTTDAYYATIHAYSEYSNAQLKVIKGNDPLLRKHMKRYHVLDQSGLSANAGDAPKTFQFAIPYDARKVVVVLGGGYYGDPDLYVSRNKPVTTSDPDCSPFSAARLAEYCEFRWGGTYNIMIDPYTDYSNVNLQVYYETRSRRNQPPYAEAGGRYGAMIGRSVAFDGSYSVDVDGSIVSYLWDFGDGHTSTEVNPGHLYAAVGDYTATLTVTDDRGVSSSDTSLVTISLTDPNDEPLCEGCSRVVVIEESGLSSLAGAEPITYSFEAPVDAALVVVKLLAGYNGDPDLHVSQNKPVSLSSFDCRPWLAPGEEENCQFTSGGTFNIMLDPYLDYSNVTIKAFYDIP